jgi:hypothetical protein
MFWQYHINLLMKWLVRSVLDSNLHHDTVQLAYNYRSSALRFLTDERKSSS